MKSDIFIGILFFLFMIQACVSEEEGLNIIKMEGKEDQLRLYKRKPVSLNFFDNKSNKLLSDEVVEVKYRGNFSFQFPKKSYSVKFNRDLDFLGLSPSNAFIINANYIDKTFIRNKLNYAIYRSLSDSNYAPKSRFVWLVWNGIEKGIYEVLERVDSDMLNLRNDDRCTCLFKDVNFNLNKEEIKSLRSNLQEYYLRDPRYSLYPKKERIEMAQNAYFEQRYPNLFDSHRFPFVYEISRLINETSDEEFEQLVFNYFDKENIIDWHILLLISNNSDGLLKNYYLYRKNCNSKYQIIPWDYDHSFGRDGDGELNSFSMLDIHRNKLLDRLLKVNSYTDELKNKYKKTRSSELRENYLLGLIDSLSSPIDNYVSREAGLWPFAAIPYFSGSSYKRELEILKNWTSKRLLKVDSIIKSY